MPQMAPMNWLILFMFFFYTFFLISNFMYFLFIKNMKLKKSMNLNPKNYNKFI
nr:ATP synthase F0 subunit 8 [Melanaphis sacchari]